MNQFKKSLVGFNILLLLADIFFYAKGKIRPFTFWALFGGDYFQHLAFNPPG